MNSLTRSHLSVKTMLRSKPEQKLFKHSQNSSDSSWGILQHLRSFAWQRIEKVFRGHYNWREQQAWNYVKLESRLKQQSSVAEGFLSISACESLFSFLPTSQFAYFTQCTKSMYFTDNGKTHFVHVRQCVLDTLIHEKWHLNTAFHFLFLFNYHKTHDFFLLFGS